MTLVENSVRRWQVLEPDRGLGATVSVFGLYYCDECRAPSLALAIWSRSEERNFEDWMLGRFGTEPKIAWVPQHGVGREYPDVPGHIASAASEAHECQSVGAYRAAGALARAVIEATAKDQGFTTGNLKSKIDAMRDAGRIRPAVAEAAHEVRYVGNDVAHGDFTQPVTEEETAETLGLMIELLREVYQSPAELSRRKAARQAKSRS